MLSITEVEKSMLSIPENSIVQTSGIGGMTTPYLPALLFDYSVDFNCNLSNPYYYSLNLEPFLNFFVFRCAV